MNAPFDLRPLNAAAKAVGVTGKTLRVWERLGFLVPRRDLSGRRLYSGADISRGRQLKAEREASRRRGLQHGRVVVAGAKA